MAGMSQFMKEYKTAYLQGLWVVYFTDFIGTTFICQAVDETWATRIADALNQMEIES